MNVKVNDFVKVIDGHYDVSSPGSIGVVESVNDTYATVSFMRKFLVSKKESELLYPSELVIFAISLEHLEVTEDPTNKVGEIYTRITYTKLDPMPEDKGTRHNLGKPQLSYMLDADVAMEGMCRVFEFGAEKYDRLNWKKGLDPTEAMDSLLRHMTAYNNGEILDPESGLPHIDHITCNAVFLATFGIRDPNETQ